MPKPRPPLLENLTLRQLRKIASFFNIPRYSRMRKAQLLNVIKNKQSALGNDNTNNAEIKQQLLGLIPKNNLIRNKNQPNYTPNRETKGAYKKKPLEGLNVSDYDAEFLADVDDDLGELPDSYGSSQLVLMPCEPRWAYAYWSISEELKQQVREQGGLNLSLRLYDVTGIDVRYQQPNNILEHICKEYANNWYIPIPLSDRNYIAEIGYRCRDGSWLGIARSTEVLIPPLYSSGWQEDIFVKVPWQKSLNGHKHYPLPSYDVRRRKRKRSRLPLLNTISSRINASLNHIPGSQPAVSPISSYSIVSGNPLWVSGKGLMSGVGLSSGAGLMSGLGLMSGAGFFSGAGLMSGAGFSADAIPAQGSQFWLMANAKLTIYGATLANAKVTIGDRQIPLNSDGSFSIEISFPDGVIDTPIVAVSEDQTHTRAIEMKFERQTNNEQKITPKQDISATDNNQNDPFINNQQVQVPISEDNQDNQDNQELTQNLDLDFPDNNYFDDTSDWFPPIR